MVGNTVAGGAAAYGFAVAGVDDFVVQGNRSEARYSGVGDGLLYRALLDALAAR